VSFVVTIPAKCDKVSDSVLLVFALASKVAARLDVVDVNRFAAAMFALDKFVS